MPKVTNQTAATFVIHVEREYNMSHHWHEEEINEFQAFHCTQCDYRVIAVPHPDLGDGGTMHFPNDKIIVVGKEKITPEEAEYLTEVWGVECKVG